MVRVITQTHSYAERVGGGKKCEWSCESLKTDFLFVACLIVVTLFMYMYVHVHVCLFPGGRMPLPQSSVDIGAAFVPPAFPHVHV